MPLSILRSTAARFALTAGVSTFATFALLTIAAVIEGRGPHPSVVAAVVWPLGALMGMAWTFGAWRAARGDVALAALGVRRGGVAGWLLVLSMPILALAPGPPARSSPIAISPERIETRTADGVVRWTWTDAGIERRGADGHVRQLPMRPRPTGTFAVAISRPGWWGLAVRMGFAALLMLGLTVHTTPGPARIVGGATIAFGLGHLVVQLL